MWSMASKVFLAFFFAAALQAQITQGIATGGTVTSIATGCGTSGGTITATGTIIATETVNVQTGTTYAILTGDCGKLVTGTNAAAQAYSIAQAGSAGFPAGWYVDVENRGAGTLTITPATSTIDGSATLALTTNQGVRLTNVGGQYYTGLRGTGSPVVLPGINNCAVFMNATHAALDCDATYLYDKTNHELNIGGSPISPSGNLYVGPDESTLPAYLQGYIGSANFLLTSTSASGLAFGMAVSGVDDAMFLADITSDEQPPIVPGGIVVDMFAGADGVSLAAFISQVDRHGHNPNQMVGFWASGGGNATGSLNQMGVLVDDMVGATNNYAIKTGLGKVELGDTLQLDLDTATQFVQAKTTVSAAAPGAAKANMRWRAGTNAGTCKLVSNAGTSATEVTIIDNVGGGC